MIEPAAQKLAAHALDLLDQGADGARMAGAALATWQAIASTLTPVIGPLGFAALYGRAVKLACAEHPWLGGVQDAAADAPAFPVLHAALLRHPVADAAAAHAGLLQAFCGVLSSLIGAALTERLLSAVWDPPSSGTEPNSP